MMLGNREKINMYVIVYDFGTSAVKTCLFDIGSEIRLIASSTGSYGLYISDDGGAERRVVDISVAGKEDDI